MKKCIFSIAALLCCVAAFPWGQKGHDVVANIARNHLTPTTLSAIDSILGGKSIVYYANWLDNASHTPKYQYSKTWHYKNVDADKTFETMPQLQSGDVLTALDRETAILRDPKQSAAERELAVKMIVHLIGDMHQPLHLGHQTDRGGNDWKVKFFDNETNLHSVWDSRVLENGHKWSYTEWTEQLDNLSPAEEAEIISGDFTSWAKGSYDICAEVYRTTPRGTKISYDYIAEWTPVIERQLLKGGLRLAHTLNSIFDPEYKPAGKEKE